MTRRNFLLALATPSLARPSHACSPDMHVFGTPPAPQRVWAEVAIHLEPGPGKPVIELAASLRTIHRFGLEDGQSGVTVALPEAEMFWVRQA